MTNVCALSTWNKKIGGRTFLSVALSSPGPRTELCLRQSPLAMDPLPWPLTGPIWVANFDADTVTKIRASDGANLGTYAFGDGPVALAFDGANIWVANAYDSTLTKI